MGAPLPKEVARQWSKWCNGTGYLATELGKEIKKHSYDELDFPSLWLHATDDPIANDENVKDMVRVYSKSNAKIISIDPKTIGLKKLGHMGFFSSKNKVLWKYAIDWLKKNE
jgi:predicted alpha/beta hydrolase